jgi:hypothetical protein
MPPLLLGLDATFSILSPSPGWHWWIFAFIFVVYFHANISTWVYNVSIVQADLGGGEFDFEDSDED